MASKTIPLNEWKQGVKYPHSEWECFGYEQFDDGGEPKFAEIRRLSKREPTHVSRALTATMFAPTPIAVEDDPTVLNAPCKIDAGDFVQFKRWWADTWAEVINAVGEPGQQMIYYCEFAERGRVRYIGWASESHEQVRRVVKANRLPMSAAVKYAKTRFERALFVGRGGPVLWPTPLATDSNATRKHPERHPVLHQ